MERASGTLLPEGGWTDGWMDVGPLNVALSAADHQLAAKTDHLLSAAVQRVADLLLLDGRGGAKRCSSRKQRQ